MIPIVVVKKDGHPVAHIGSLDEDEDVRFQRSFLPRAPTRRLAEPEFAFHLADAVMNSIDKRWKEIGAEDRASDSVAKLRSRYTISRSDINTHHNQQILGEIILYRSKGSWFFA
jgi:hypothetical protein